MFTCGLTAAGAAYCQGYGADGETGQPGDWSGQPDFVPVAGNLSFTKISTGGYHACAISNDGLLWCW